MTTLVRRTCLVAVVALALSFLEAPASGQAEIASTTAHTASRRRSLEVLQIAYDAASMMPLRPHHKTRSRLQVEVIEAVLEVEGGMAVAAQWSDGIEGWRRGLAYGEIASWLARDGQDAAAREFLRTAEVLEASATEDRVQGWRRDRMRVGIAEAYALLGDLDRAANIQARVDGEAGGRISVIAATLVAEDAIDGQVAVLLEIAENGAMDQVRYALESIAHFYGRVHRDPERRDELEVAIRGAWGKLPLQPRIEILEILVGYDVENASKGKAGATIDEIEALVLGNTFQPAQSIELRAKVAMLRASAGDREAGLRAADAALARYGEVRESINSIWRGRALRPLAVAYVRLGETVTANDLLERALVEAVVNPNSRPRAEDLVRTCTTITTSGLEARDSLMAALRRTRGMLADPW